PLGPDALVTMRAIVPPVTVPFRLSGRQLDFAWSPDLPGPLDVEVELEVCGPRPGGGAASANDATMPAAKSATSGMKYFMEFLSLGEFQRGTPEGMDRLLDPCALPRTREKRRSGTPGLPLERALIL